MLYIISIYRIDDLVWLFIFCLCWQSVMYFFFSSFSLISSFSFRDWLLVFLLFSLFWFGPVMPNWMRFKSFLLDSVLPIHIQLYTNRSKGIVAIKKKNVESFICIVEKIVSFHRRVFCALYYSLHSKWNRTNGFEKKNGKRCTLRRMLNIYD